MASTLVTALLFTLAALRPGPDEPAVPAAGWPDVVMPLLEVPETEAAVAAEPEPDPDPTTFPQRAAGTFTAAAPVDVEAAGSGRDVRYSVEVEDGLDHQGDVVARQVADVLGDRRGWRTQGWSFTQVAERPAVRVLLASPETVDALCAPLLTRGEVSCRTGDRVVLNVKRWVLGAESYRDDLQGYRQYLVNHEVGHFLGFGHVGCPAPGTPAPVMLQQTKGLQGCVKNPWP